MRLERETLTERNTLLERKTDVVIVGGGPAGLAAAAALREKGVEDIVLLEREDRLGGVLNQCIHDGFGLERYGENYSGPEYAAFDIEKVDELGIETHCCAAVLSVTRDAGWETAAGPQRLKVLTAEPEGEGVYRSKAVIAATGCRERTRGAIEIPGSRPAGIYTAGEAQSFLNLHDLLPGKRIVIVGSGDIGLIMARRLTLEGAEVVCVVEKESVPGGLQRNIVQCLEDFGIPLHLNAEIRKVYGKDRVTGVDIEQTVQFETHSWHCSCDTLITSVGLIPENEILQTEGPGLFVVGNARYVHDLVDQVSQEGIDAAGEAVSYLNSLEMDAGWKSGGNGTVGDGERNGSEKCGCGINRESFSIERLKSVREAKKRELAARKREAAAQNAWENHLTGNAGQKELTCILCPNGCRIGQDLSGARCDKGRRYAREELVEKRRVLTTSVKVEGGDLPLVSVRTDRRIPKDCFKQAMEEICAMTLDAPVKRGQTVCEDLAGTGARVVATKDVVPGTETRQTENH